MTIQNHTPALGRVCASFAGLLRTTINAINDLMQVRILLPRPPSPVESIELSRRGSDPVLSTGSDPVLRRRSTPPHLKFQSGLKRPAAHAFPLPDWACVGLADHAAKSASSNSPAAVHYVGFRDDRYWNAFRIWGGPRVIHRWWDKRAQRDIGPDDIVIFADGDWRQEPRRFSAPDIVEPTQ